MHRDMKPANVMVGAFGEIQVMDWGLAKVVGRPSRSADQADPAVDRRGGDAASEGRSLAGDVMGTPAYMPPEQALGQVDRVDERSDVFALGSILCEILTGVPPLRRSSGRQRSPAGRPGRSRGGDETARLLRRRRRAGRARPLLPAG